MGSPPTRVLLRLLEPWLVRARGRLQLSFDVFAQSETLADKLWIQWKVPKHGVIAIEDVEAIELLELLVRVDSLAGWTLLLEMTGTSAYLDQILDAATTGAIRPRYELIRLRDSFTNSAFTETIRWLLFAVDPDDHSPMYYAIRQTLLQCWADRHDQGRVADFTRKANDLIPLKVDAALWALSDDEATRKLKEIAMAASLTQKPDRLELISSSQQDRDHRNLTLSDVFTFHAVRISLGSRTELTDVIMDTLREMWERSSVFVEKIELSHVSSRHLSTTGFLRSMLLRSGLPHTPRSLHVGDGHDIRDFEATCSTIQSSPSIEKVFFELPVLLHPRTRDVRKLWAWIAYAAFSADAAPQLKHVVLSMERLTQELVDVFTQVLDARDPLAYLSEGPFRLPSAETAGRAPSIVEVIPNATLFVGEQRVRLQTENRVEVLRVVDNSPDKQHVCVVYPGAGICWVHRSQIRRHCDITAPRTHRLFRSLRIEISMDSLSGDVLMMLRYIGTDLSRLVIIGEMGVVLDDDFFAEMFSVCPNLRSLDLVNSEVTTFDWLGTSACRLTSISLRDVAPRQHDGYRRMLTTIVSAKTALVELHIQDLIPFFQTEMDTIFEMLDTNRHLERFFLSIHDDDIDKEAQDVRVQRLEALNGRPLSMQTAPLAMNCKLAFLRVVSCELDRDGALESEPTTVATQLDTAVISIIFRFAALCKHRVCRFIPPVEPLFFWPNDDSDDDLTGDAGDNE